ncbi:MAG: response regulator, partial [Proteobacteria bacterium]|nr:response regulator [Pseudomonadota bacterium]
YLANIQTSGENLSELINNILDLSKIEAEKITLSRENINFRLLIQGIYHINRAQAFQKEVKFSYEFDPRLPDVVRSDRTKLHQILMNLVSNAIKFTPGKKAVVLRAKRKEDRIVLQVEDQGIGIPKSRQKRVFEAFEQVDDSMTRHYGGTGLGLAIVKKMTELLKGEIRLESQEGKGSLFSVEIPLVEERSEESETEETNWEDVRFSPDNKVLVVEDEPTNRGMIEVLFDELGMDIETADDGKTGVQKAIELKPDLVLMDMHMPGMSGMEATQQIRLHPVGQGIPIVALSADAFVDQQNAAYEAGVSSYLTKPLNFKNLVPVLAKYLRRDRPVLPTSRESAEPTPLPGEIEKRLLEEFDSLLRIPPYDAMEVKLQVEKMIELGRGFDSPYDKVLRKILQASLSRNSQQIPQLIKEILHG